MSFSAPLTGDSGVVQVGQPSSFIASPGAGGVLHLLWSVDGTNWQPLANSPFTSTASGFLPPTAQYVKARAQKVAGTFVVSSPGSYVNTNRTYLRRKEMAAYRDNGALIAAPAWSNNGGAGQAYDGKTPSFAVKLPNGQLVGVSTGGTGAVGAAPTFSGQALMTDGTVVWSSLGRVSRVASAREVPTVSTGASNPGGTVATQFLNATGVGWVMNGYSGLKFNFPCGIGDYSQYGNGYFMGTNSACNTGSSNLFSSVAGTAGIIAGGMVEFITDAPVIAFNMTNLGATPYYLYVGEVDGQNMFLVEEGDSVAALASNPYWRIYTWPAGRKLRRYRMEGSNAGGFQTWGVTQYAVAAADVLYPAPNDGLKGLIITDSWGNTASPVATGTFPMQMFGALALRGAGIRYPAVCAQASAGYVAGSTTWQGASATVQIPLLFSNNAFSPSTIIGNNTVFGTPTQWIPDVVVFAAGFNDVGSAAATIQANALTSFQSARALWPSAIIVVFGPQIGNHNGSANQLTCEASIAAAFTQWNDANSAYYPVSNDPAGAWTTGVGAVGSTSGTGNSDFYTGSDITHPPVWGHVYYGNRLAMLIDQALAAKGL